MTKLFGDWWFERHVDRVLEFPRGRVDAVGVDPGIAAVLDSGMKCGPNRCANNYLQEQLTRKIKPLLHGSRATFWGVRLEGLGLLDAVCSGPESI